MILHLFYYRAAPGHEAELDGFMRTAGLAALRATDGIVAAYVGRRLGRLGQEHLVVTARDAPDTWRPGTGTAGMPPAMAPKASLLQDVSSKVFLEARTVVRPGLPRILRVFRGALRDDLAVDPALFVAEAVARAADTPGCLAIHGGLPVDPEPDGGPAIRVCAVSAWESWERLLAAHSGRLSEPLLADHRGVFTAPSVDHYEILGEDVDVDEPLPAGRAG